MYDVTSNRRLCSEPVEDNLRLQVGMRVSTVLMTISDTRAHWIRRHLSEMTLSRSS